MMEKKQMTTELYTHTHTNTLAIHFRKKLFYFKFKLGWLYFRHNLKSFKLLAMKIRYLISYQGLLSTSFIKKWIHFYSLKGFPSFDINPYKLSHL